MDQNINYTKHRVLAGAGACWRGGCIIWVRPLKRPWRRFWLNVFYYHLKDDEANVMTGERARAEWVAGLLEYSLVYMAQVYLVFCLMMSKFQSIASQPRATDLIGTICSCNIWERGPRCCSFFPLKALNKWLLVQHRFAKVMLPQTCTENLLSVLCRLWRKSETCKTAGML